MDKHITRERLEDIVTRIKVVDVTRGAEKRIAQTLLMDKIVKLLKDVQQEGTVVDKNIFDALPDDDSRVTVIVAYCSLVISILNHQLK